MKEVTTALIGCGQRGPWHGQRINSSPKMRLLAVCDLDEPRARRTSELLGVDYALDYRKLLEREDLDSVIIATHTRHHGNIAIDAARAGKHILVEKPLVDTVETGKKLVRAADEAGIVGMVAYQLRFTEFSSTLKKEAQSLKPLQALLTVQRGMMAPQYFFPEHYGGVIDTASHTIHRGLWLMEGRPNGVYATLRRGTFRGGDTIDFANLMIDFDGGRTVTIVTSLGAPNTQNIIQVIGRKGSLTTNDMKTLEVMRHKGFRMDKSAIDKEVQSIPTNNDHDPVIRMQNHFADLITESTSRRYGNTLRDGMIAVAVTQAMAQSARTGERICLEDMIEGFV